MSPFQKFLNKFATKKVVTIMLVITILAIVVIVLGFTGILESVATNIQSSS